MGAATGAGEGAGATDADAADGTKNTNSDGLDALARLTAATSAGCTELNALSRKSVPPADTTPEPAGTDPYMAPSGDTEPTDTEHP